MTARDLRGATGTNAMRGWIWSGARGGGARINRDRELRKTSSPPSDFRDYCTAASVRQSDLDQVVIEHGAASHVRLALRRRLIRVGAVGGELAPPDRRRPDDARSDRRVDARHRGECAAIV